MSIVNDHKHSSSVMTRRPEYLSDIRTLPEKFNHTVGQVRLLLILSPT
jgi:hypothetical protein